MKHTFNKRKIYGSIVVLLILCIVTSCMYIPSTVCKPNNDTASTPTTNSSCTNSTTPSTSITPDTHTHQHEYPHWQTVVSPTCTKVGTEISICECGAKEQREIPTLMHNLTEWQGEPPATCLEAGVEYRHCNNCDYIEKRCVEALGHELSSWEIMTELTCEKDEIQIRHCTRCDYIEHATTQTATGHSFGKYQTQKESTCTQAGSKVRKCAVCGKEETSSIQAKGHNYQNGTCTRCQKEDPNHWPKTYKDDGVSITIYKVTGYGGGNTTCYIADVQLTDYTRFFTACGKNKYGGQSGTSAAAKLQNAVLAINGCYSAPNLGYTVVRRGIIHNGADRNLCLPAVYSSKTGLFSNDWEGQRNDLIGKNVKELVDAGLVTDTFCFGPPILVDGIVTGGTGGGRAQRTFIGTNGTPGHLLLCVSNGRYSDGVSAGLTYQEMGQLMKDYGCNFGIPLDGGGSSTMVFKGQILNQLANGQERTWIVDFCCVGY